MIPQSIRFNGDLKEDPNQHIANFPEICDTFKSNGVADDAIRLRLFPFSLGDKANGWLMALPPGTITTWNDLAQKFLTKFFPPAKSAKLRNDITSFLQDDAESLYEAWERYKELMRKCPHHGLPVWFQVQTFYNGLMGNVQTMVDVASGGALQNKTPEEAYELLEVLASNNYQRPNERATPRKSSGLHEVDAFTAISAQLTVLQKQLGTMHVNSIQAPQLTCEFCAGNHVSSECQVGNTFASSSSSTEQVKYLAGNQRQPNNPYSNTYNPRWRNHPNLAWGNQNQQNS